MADYYRVTYHLRQFNLGWRYIFYLQKDSARQAVVQARDKKNKLMAMHNFSVILGAISAANVDPLERDHYLLNLEDNFQVNDQAVGPTDVTQTAALVTLRTQATRSRKIWLRGLNDDFVTRSGTGQSTPTAAFNRKLNAWLADIPAAGWLLRYIEQPVPASAFEWKDVTSIEEEPNSNGAFTIVTCRVPHGINAGEHVRFSFDNKDLLLLGFKGEHKPVSIEVQGDDTKMVVPVTFRSKTSPYLPHRMRVRLAQYNYVALNGDGDFVRFRSRDTGRAPGPKGREAGISFR